MKTRQEVCSFWSVLRKREKEGRIWGGKQPGNSAKYCRSWGGTAEHRNVWRMRVRTGRSSKTCQFYTKWRYACYWMKEENGKKWGFTKEHNEFFFSIHCCIFKCITLLTHLNRFLDRRNFSYIMYLLMGISLVFSGQGIFS